MILFKYRYSIWIGLFSTTEDYFLTSAHCMGGLWKKVNPGSKKPSGQSQKKKSRWMTTLKQKKQ